MSLSAVDGGAHAAVAGANRVLQVRVRVTVRIRVRVRVRVRCSDDYIVSMHGGTMDMVIFISTCVTICPFLICIE